MNGFTRLGIAGLASLVLAAPLVGARPETMWPPAGKPDKAPPAAKAPRATPPPASASRGSTPRPGPPTQKRGPKPSKGPSAKKGAGKGIGQSRADQAQAAAQARKAAIRARVSGHQVTVTQAVCERHEDQIAHIVPSLSRGAESVKGSLDTMYAHVTDFYASGQLTVENYDGMIVYVDAMRANAAASLATLGDFAFEVECTNPGVGRQLMEYRTAVRAASESLSDYRTAVVALISSMRASAADNDGTSEGGTDD